MSTHRSKASNNRSTTTAQKRRLDSDCRCDGTMPRCCFEPCNVARFLVRKRSGQHDGPATMDLILMLPGKPKHPRCTAGIVAFACIAGCNGSDHGFNQPNVHTEPIDTITLMFTNASTEDVFVPWMDGNPAFKLQQGNMDLMTHRSCIPDCGSGCECAACTDVGVVRRIPSMETLSVPFVPVHFVMNTCGGSVGCYCLESWPITVGRYSLFLGGFTNAVGGRKSAEQPELLHDTTPGAGSRTCSASLEFDIEAGGSTAETSFRCD